MTIPTTASTVIYDGNDSVTTFAFTWKIQLSTDIKVVLIDANDANTDVSSSEYTITGIGDISGGSIEYPVSGSPLATGMRLAITPATLFTQETDLGNQGSYYPETIEDMVDRTTLQIQKINDETDRTFIIPIGVSPVTTPEELYNNILTSESACEAYANETEGYRDEVVVNNYYPYAVDSSAAANTITVTNTTPLVAYTEGQKIKVKMANTVTGATVINIDALGDKAVQFSGSALITNQLTAGLVYEFCYDGTQFQVSGSISVFDAITGTTITGTTFVGLPVASTILAGISKLITNAEILVGTDSSRAITTSALKSLIGGTSRAGDGYAKLLVGIGTGFGELIIQWGTENVNAGSTKTFTLPYSFSTIGLNHGSSYNDNATAGGSPCGSYNLTTTQLSLANAQGSAENINWYAIGY